MYPPVRWKMSLPFVCIAGKVDEMSAYVGVLILAILGAGLILLVMAALWQRR